jgi:basic membrane protein A
VVWKSHQSKKYVKGYEAGAKSIKADVAVKSVYIDTFTDRARGAEAAKSFMSEGADVIFGAGGRNRLRWHPSRC